MATGSDDLDRITSEWPDKPAEIADEKEIQPGSPDGMTERRLIWHDAGD